MGKIGKVGVERAEEVLREFEDEFDGMCDRFDDALAELRAALRSWAGGKQGEREVLGWFVKHLNTSDPDRWFGRGMWREHCRSSYAFSSREEAVLALRTQRTRWADIHPEWRFGLVRIVPRGTRKKKGGK